MGIGRILFKNNVLSAVAAGVVAFTAGSAKAVTTIFDPSGPRSDLTARESFASGPVTLDVLSTVGLIHQNRNGLGVSGNPDRNRLGSSASGVETLTFVFSRRVMQLAAIVFEHRSGKERLVMEDGSGNVLRTFLNNGVAGNPSTQQPVDPLAPDGDTVVFRHVTGSGIRVRQLTVAAMVGLGVAAASQVSV